MDNFKHEALPGERFTRILKLLPSNGSDVSLRCELLIVSLDKLPKYEALSYAWGAPVLSSFIFCNGKRLGITQNCEAAIRRLRQPKKSRLVWVDSICIDQTSIEEKNKQVKHMGQIYSEAEKVIVWLGESTPQSEIAFKYFQRIYNIVTKTRLLFKQTRSLLAIDKELGRLKAECEKYRVQNIPLLDGVFKDIYSRSWFSRVWTIQEVALSRHTVMLCGTTEISFAAFVSGSSSLSVIENRPWAENPLLGLGLLAGSVGLHSLMMRALENRPRKHYKVSDETTKSFPGDPKLKTGLKRSTILQLAHAKTATEPRDKVYALHGLFEALGIPLIKDKEVDYNKPTEDIYFYETLAAISEESSLDVFYSLTGNENIDFPNLPSWIPDWSDTTSPRCTNYRFYGASGPSKPTASFLSAPDMTKITILVRIIGIVDKVADRSMPRLGAVEDSKFENILPTIHSWATFCEPRFTKQGVMYVRPKKYYNQENFELSDFCDILVRGNAPYFDPFNEEELPHNKVQVPNPEYLKELKRMGRVWAPIATSLTTEILYQRLKDYPQSIVSTNIMTGISKALEGTPSARTYHRLVEVISEGLVMFKTDTGFFGTALPNVREKDEVALIAGLSMPFILRPGATDNEGYRILGPAYVQDTMSGEYWSDVLTPENFTLTLV